MYICVFFSTWFRSCDEKETFSLFSFDVLQHLVCLFINLIKYLQFEFLTFLFNICDFIQYLYISNNSLISLWYSNRCYFRYLYRRAKKADARKYRQIGLTPLGIVERFRYVRSCQGNVKNRRCGPALEYGSGFFGNYMKDLRFSFPILPILDNKLFLRRHQYPTVL